MEQKNSLSKEDNLEIENLFNKYKSDPDSVDDNWKIFFEGMEFAQLSKDNSPSQTINQLSDLQDLEPEFKVFNLINGYRVRGHLFTRTNPVRERRQYTPTLALENFGLSEADLDTEYKAGTLIGIGPARLSAIIEHLNATYCGSIGAEYRYIRKPEIREWLETKMEKTRNSKSFQLDEKKTVLRKINQAVAFEKFIHTKFVGQKSFSLEGCEALIPALSAVIDYGADLDIKEFVIGTSHRGRLSVLANILGKSFEEIFTEFEGLDYDDNNFAGDVKYHLGFSSDVETENGKKIHLSLTANPSHLEAVDPLVQGIVRSKLDRTPEATQKWIAPILIHGDAAIAGQGIVYELIQMSLLKGYSTGGTIHLVINNQIGFTTNYTEARSSTYCTDVAKVTLSPVFHVNADDVEALIYTVRLAIEFRQKFHRDVFIDILGYRKYGHNENDEPRFTQPKLYKAIAEHPDLREIYIQKLMNQGDIEINLVKEMEAEFKSLLQNHFEAAKRIKKITPPNSSEYPKGKWKGMRTAVAKDFDHSPATAVDKETLLRIGEESTNLPKDKKFFDKTTKLFADRKSQIQKGDKINWARAEHLAYASLLNEGTPVRLSGQDVERGTFSHRHAVLPIDEGDETYTPLNNIQKDQAKFHVFNSHLSEYAVLGFEYGYSLSSPFALVLWEAQFGDFSNGAQVIIDQYLSSAEDKWRLMNGLVLLLPHGYEGQGSEHSSARLERFLQLCAELNIQVANVTTPANFFHIIRRQVHRDFRKPLVLMTPKSLLRHPRCVSTLDDLSMGKFQELIDDKNSKPEETNKVVLCSGKLYYELLEEKEKLNARHIALIRIEQLYPFPHKQFDSLFDRYRNVKEWIWAQEEPENMGAWTFLLRTLKKVSLQLISRAESASPATGSHKTHEREQREIIDKIFRNNK